MSSIISLLLYSPGETFGRLEAGRRRNIFPSVLNIHVLAFSQIPSGLVATAFQSHLLLPFLSCRVPRVVSQPRPSIALLWRLTVLLMMRLMVSVLCFRLCRAVGARFLLIGIRISAVLTIRVRYTRRGLFSCCRCPRLR